MNAHDVLRATLGGSADQAIAVAEKIANKECPATVETRESQLFREAECFLNETASELQRVRDLAFLDSTSSRILEAV